MTFQHYGVRPVLLQCFCVEHGCRADASPVIEQGDVSLRALIAVNQEIR